VCLSEWGTRNARSVYIQRIVEADLSGVRCSLLAASSFDDDEGAKDYQQSTCQGICPCNNRHEIKSNRGWSPREGYG